MLATFDRKKESSFWLPVLVSHGFTDLELTPSEIDKLNATDMAGYDAQRNPKLFALRCRDGSAYTTKALAKYKRQFTIRYDRPSGTPSEWQKLFEMQLPRYPDYFVYGWCNEELTKITDYVVLDVPILQILYKEGHLNSYCQNKLRNTNGLRSQFVYIPIPELLRLPSAENLIVHHSENHPALQL